MKSVARWSVENRVPVNILMVLLVVGGVLAFRQTPREVFPIFPQKIVSVAAPYKMPSKVSRAVRFRTVRAG